jgi:metallo-beta-lactamase family protein
MTGEWIRLTDPVYRKKTTNAGERAPAEKKRTNTDYLALKNALLDLSMYIDQLSNHSNSELRDLTQKIRALISDQV